MTPVESIPLEHHTLGNGLQVVLHPDAHLPLVTVNLWYHVGSKNERPGRTGFAHLFEHMLFQGSEHVGTNDHFHYVQQVGGIANGSTWYDRTNYFETLPAHQLDLGLWLESDRMGFLLPALTEEKLETQRQVVMNERRQRVDNQPYGRAFERLYELLYPEPHPYHWPVIGYMEDIAAASLEEIRDFFRTYYVPNNAVLTVAGDIEPEHALSRIEAYFGSIPAGEAPPPLPSRPELPRGGQREVLPDAVRLPRLHFGFRIPPVGTPEWYAADLLCNLLAIGRSSVLEQELVYHRQIAQDVYAWVYPTEETSTLALIATARPGVTAEELEAAILDAIERFRREPVPEAQLEKARNAALTDFFTDFQRLHERADRLSQMTTFYGDPFRLRSEHERYQQVQPEDILDLASRYLAPEGRAIVIVVPERGDGA